METRTITLRLDAYERLCGARRFPEESLSDVVMRARWPVVGITARELAELYDRKGPFFGAGDLDRVEEAKASDEPPRERWGEG